MSTNSGVNAGFSQLTAKRNNIVQQQQQNDASIANNQRTSGQNSADMAQNTEKISTSNAKIEGFNASIAQVSGKQEAINGEVASLKSQLDKASDEDVQREINSKIEEKEMSLSDIKSEIDKLNQDLKTEQENLKASEAKNEKLTEEKTNLDKEVEANNKKKIELDKALQEVEAEIAVFDDIYKSANGKADDITPETIDNAFSKLENAVLKDGVELKKETKNKDGSVVREYSDGTKLCYRKGGYVELDKPLSGSKQVDAGNGETMTEGWTALGRVSTSEFKNAQEDEFFFTVTDGRTDKDGRLAHTGVSNSYNYHNNSEEGESSTFSSKASSVSINGHRQIKGKNASSLKHT